MNDNFVNEISDLLGFIELKKFDEKKIIRIENILPSKKIVSQKIKKTFLTLFFINNFFFLPTGAFASTKSKVMLKEKNNVSKPKAKGKTEKKIISVIQVNIYHTKSNQSQNNFQNASVFHGLLLQLLNQQNQIRSGFDFFEKYLPEKNIFYSPTKRPFLILKLNGNDNGPSANQPNDSNYESMSPEQLRHRLKHETNQKEKWKILFWLYFKFLLGSIFIFFIILILKKLLIQKSPMTLEGDYLSYEDIELLKTKGEDEEDLIVTDLPVIAEELKEPNLVVRMTEIIQYTVELLNDLKNDLICSEKPVRIKIFGKNGQLVDAKETYYTFLLGKFDEYLNPEFFQLLKDWIIKIDDKEDYLFNFSNQDVLIFMIKVFCQSIDYDDFDCVIQLINHKI